MSNMHDTNSDIHRAKGRAVILHRITHPGPLKANRFQLLIIFSLMVVVLMLGFILFPTNSLLKNYELKQVNSEAYKIPMNPAVSAEINTLKGQLVGLISGSIESKLRSLELSIRSGTVSSKDLGVIQDLKNDVKVLKTYSATGAGRLIATQEPELVSAKKTNSVTKEQFFEEVSQLKSLIYLSIASCGLMVAAIGGVWLQGRNRLLGDTANEANRPKKMLPKINNS